MFFSQVSSFRCLGNPIPELRPRRGRGQHRDRATVPGLRATRKRPEDLDRALHRVKLRRQRDRAHQAVNGRKVGGLLDRFRE